MTVDAIFDAVRHELGKGVGLVRVGMTDKLVAGLDSSDLRAARSLLHVRPGVSFSVNTTQAGSGKPTISVRAHGVDCGFIVFTSAGRMFRPSPKFMGYWRKSDKPELEWGERGVSRFVAACTNHSRGKYWSRESRIQERLFQQMYGGGRGKTGLRGLQPVLFAGIPVQLALPVRPRGASGEFGKQKGHSDLVARSSDHGRLVVFEIKRPDASPSECIGALEQAVTYAAALDYLMSRTEHRAAYWRLLGSRRGLRHAPKFSAVAFLDEAGSGKCEVKLRAKLAELQAANGTNYGLKVMRYREVGDSLKIVGEFLA